MNKKGPLILPHPQQNNDEYRRCTAMFLFWNTADPGSQFYTRAMWDAFRYHLGETPSRLPCNLPLMDYVLCPSEWQRRKFENHYFAAIMRGVEGKIPQRIECQVPDAELVVVDGSPTDILICLEKGWIPQSTKKVPVIAIGAKAAVA